MGIKKTVALIIIAAALFSSASAGGLYPRIHEPPVPPKLIELPLGKVKPEGWLKDFSLTASKGLFAYIDQHNAPFSNHPWEQTTQGNDWTVYEQSAYWVDGLIRMGHILGDETLLAKARKSLYNQAKQAQPHFSPTQWPFAVFSRAVLAEYQATGDTTMLNLLKKAYRSASATSMQQGQQRRDVENIETMFETFSLGGDSALLKTAVAALDSASWYSHDASIDKDPHGVSWLELHKLPAIMSMWNKKSSFLKWSMDDFDELDTCHVLPNGCCSSSERVCGIDGSGMTETCDVADFLWSNVWMARVSGKSKYGDRIESDFYNGGIGNVDSTYSKFCYLQQVNHIDWTNSGFSAMGGSFNTNQYACCTGNLCRIIPNFISHMWMATPDSGLAALLYGPCSVKANVANNDAVTITTATMYPYEGKVTMIVTPVQPTYFPIYLRIPAWSKNKLPTITVNGTPVAFTVNNDGFAVVTRSWDYQGDSLVVNFSMDVRTTTTKVNHSSYPPLRIDSWGPQSMTVYRGPVAYSMPVAMTDENTMVPGTVWQYALVAQSNGMVRNAKVNTRQAASPFKFGISSVPASITVDAMPITWGTMFNPSILVESRFYSGNGPTAEWITNIPKNSGSIPVTESNVKQITLYPYGTTIGRITMFPMTAPVAVGAIVKSVLSEHENFTVTKTGKQLRVTNANPKSDWRVACFDPQGKQLFAKEFARGIGHAQIGMTLGNARGVYFVKIRDGMMGKVKTFRVMQVN